ncbi:hypothetical protein [Microbacterium hydrocarbonoxydans]|uniref:hypothetical protein n=1 Tax=Microbacterium hydrocarbonoxydans TaxID=273678 RepID=UPI00203D31E4|nr:hypothetical protein [Microbacterium hydrocarbonoxydans]MCM3779869.1 hypothetical protein [Microbacterium hydrocarbonoxydans]
MTTEDSRREFLEGARLLRLDQRRNFAGEIVGPTPIQLAITDTLAAGLKVNGILEPRRTTKTTAIQATLIGRCALREDYLVGWTLATTGAKAGERFKKDVAAPLQRLYPDVKAREEFVKISLSKGSEGLLFRNGSSFDVYAPSGDGFRSNAFDVAWVDEAGEAELELGEDLTAAIRPTLHTRHQAQFVLSGTAGAFRSGQLLWDALTDPTAAVLSHGLPDDVDPDELEDWEPSEEHPRARVREHVLRVHPGIGWTTPLEVIKEDFDTPAMRKKFPAEILSVFALEGSNTALLSQPKWQAAALPLTEAGSTPPARFCMVPFVHPDGTYASIAAAWSGPKDTVNVGLLHHQKGTEGFAQKLLDLARKHKRDIVYDPKSAATEVEVRRVRESRRAPAERPVLSKDVARAAINLTKILNEGHLRHFDQPELTSAAEVAVKRGWNYSSGWSLGRPKGQEEVDISGLEAVALAAYKLLDERERGDLTSAIIHG